MCARRSVTGLIIKKGLTLTTGDEDKVSDRNRKYMDV